MPSRWILLFSSYSSKITRSVVVKLTKLHLLSATTLYCGVRKPSQVSYALLNESHCELHSCTVSTSMDNKGEEGLETRQICVTIYLCTFGGLLVVIKHLRVEAYTQQITLACDRRFLHSLRQLLWSSDLFGQHQRCNFADLRVPVEVTGRLLQKVQKYVHTTFKLQNTLECTSYFLEGCNHDTHWPPVSNPSSLLMVPGV